MKLHAPILILLLLKVSFSDAQTCRCRELDANKEISISSLLNSPESFCTAKGFEKLTSQFLNDKNLDSAAHYLQLAEALYQKEACNKEQWIPVYKLRSALHFSQAEYEKSLEYSLKMLPFAQEKGNKEEEAELLLGISQIFARMKQLEKGLDYTRQSLPLIEIIKPGPSKVDLLNKAGSRFYFFFQDTKSPSLFDSARLYFNAALRIAKDINYKKGMQVSYNKMNSLAYQQKNFELSLRYLDSSIALSAPGEINNAIATSFGDKGNILLKLGRFKEAKKWADSCLYYYQNIKFPPLIANAYSLVAEIADSLGDFASAYHALYQEKKITDSLNTAENAKAVTEVEKKYHQAKNEKTIRELNQQKQIYALLAIAGLLAAGVIAFYLRQQSLKNKQKILETEQRLNRARMNPHFFFNALTALQRFAMKENNGVALASSLSKFSHIMRETLESSYKEYVTIRQELEFLKEYLEIQKMRFPSTFNYSLMIDGELDPGDILIPSMIIQPFIENSIEHGFAAISYTGELRVDFKLENKLIKIEITDNGQGLSSPGSRQNEHISRASQIIKDRIYLLNIKLKSKAAFSIDNNKNGPGVSVQIQLPYSISMKILLVDNEKEIRELLKDMIRAIYHEPCTIEEAEGVSSALQKIHSFKPDLVFLDVEMGDGTGFDLMQQLTDPAFQLVFTTAHNQYAIQAFKYSAIDYLLKPIDITELETCIRKAAGHISKNNLSRQLEVLMQQLNSSENSGKQIVLKDSEASYFVKVADILYCEAEGSYTKFYFALDKPIVISKNLSTYEDLLGTHGFLRTHHSYLVNPRHIKMYDKTDGGTLILDSGHTVPVSHRKKDHILQLLENR